MLHITLFELFFISIFHNWSHHCGICLLCQLCLFLPRKQSSRAENRSHTAPFSGLPDLCWNFAYPLYHKISIANSLKPSLGMLCVLIFLFSGSQPNVAQTACITPWHITPLCNRSPLHLNTLHIMVDEIPTFVQVSPFGPYCGDCNVTLSLEKGIGKHAKDAHPENIFHNATVVRAVKGQMICLQKIYCNDFSSFIHIDIWQKLMGYRWVCTYLSHRYYATVW